MMSPPSGLRFVKANLKRAVPCTTYESRDEAAVQLPHDGQEAYDILLDDADAVAGHVHQQRVRRRFHGVRVPLLVVLGLDERPLAVLVHHRVKVHRLAGPVDLVACRRWEKRSAGACQG